MQDLSTGDKKAKDLTQTKLGVSGTSITKPKLKPKREKPSVQRAAVQSRAQPPQPVATPTVPPLPAAPGPALVRTARSQKPQPAGVRTQDEEDRDLLGRFSRLGV